METIKLIKDSHRDILTNEYKYRITGLEVYCEVTKDLNEWKATMYEMGDTVVYTVWGETPRKSANKLLANFDLKIGGVA